MTLDPLRPVKSMVGQLNGQKSIYSDKLKRLLLLLSYILAVRLGKIRGERNGTLQFY